MSQRVGNARRRAESECHGASLYRNRLAVGPGSRPGCRESAWWRAMPGLSHLRSAIRPPGPRAFSSRRPCWLS